MLIDRRLISRFDWVLLGTAMGVAVLGILTIYSATHNPMGEGSGPLAWRQFYWFLVGLVGMVLAFSVDYHYISHLAYPFYATVLFLLLLVHLLGAVGGGSQRWLDLGLFTLQPSELAKLAIVLVLTKHLQYDPPPRGYGLWDCWMPFVLVLPFILLILLQPDLGTAVILSVVFVSVLLVGGLRLRYFLYMVVAGVTLLPIGWQFLKTYQQQRIWTFFNPDLDPLGAGYHVIQSKIAIGSGRFFGKGFLQGTQNRLDFLPAQHTDFVFSVFAEEWGFFGCLILLGVYLTLILFSLNAVGRAKDRFGAILAFGMVAILFWQVVINVAMVAGLLPVVGITLPLFSYGGSSLVSMMFAVGLLINVSMRRFIF